jgi:hypothetical protein
MEKPVDSEVYRQLSVKGLEVKAKDLRFDGGFGLGSLAP